MKRILTLLMVMQLFAAANIHAENTFKHVNVFINNSDNCNLYGELSDYLYFATFNFNEPIEANTPDACMLLKQGERIILKKPLDFKYYKNETEVLTYFYDEGDNEEASIEENNRDLLPGNTYELILPAGSLRKINDHSALNEECVYKLKIAEACVFGLSSLEHLNLEIFNPEEEDKPGPIASTSYILFYSGAFMDSIDGGKITLYRENLPIATFPVTRICHDIDDTFVDYIFPQKMNFEQDVRYSFTIPKGVYCEGHRKINKIYNAEANVYLKGNCGRTFNKIAYSWCSASDKHIDKLDEVNLRYNTSIALAPNARLQLCEPNGVVLKEATASLSRQTDGSYMLTADFGGVDISKNDYVLCIPEATVVGTGSDITINERNLIPLNGYVLSVDAAKTSQPSITLTNGTLRITALQQGDRISVCTSDGTQLTSATAAGSNFTTTLPQKGLYIVRVNGWATKVAAMK